jgi:tetratricopeptide (TPR) repeat protein
VLVFVTEASVMRRLKTLFAGVVLAAAIVAPDIVAAADVAQARELAGSGHRDESIRLLFYILSQDPTDTEARTLLGTVLSWEGRYDDARREFANVLATNPTHGDALPAAINVELWSGHPDAAASLADRGLAARPDDVALRNARARALYAMGKGEEALKDSEHVLAPRAEQHRGARPQRAHSRFRDALEGRGDLHVRPPLAR